MKKLTVLFVLLIVVTGMVFANDYVAVRISTGANATASANHSFTFSNNFSLARASNIEEALANLCNYMSTNGYELLQLDLYPNSTTWIALFKKK